MSGPRFVDIPADRLLGELKTIGAAVVVKGGRFFVSKQGAELVVDIVPPNGVAMVRIYTSLAAHASHVRGCGEDAVRMFICSPKSELPSVASGDNMPIAEMDGADIALNAERARRAALSLVEYMEYIPAIPLEGSQKILRTAPQAAPDRVAVFLARLRDEVRAAYGRALTVPRCPACKTRAMKLRTTRDGARRFFGCVGYPACRGTMNENEVRR